MRTGGHDEAHLLRELAAQRLDLVGDAMALHVVDERQQAVAEFDAQQIERQRGRDRLFLRRRIGLRFRFLLATRSAAASVFLLVGKPGERADAGGKAREHQGRHARAAPTTMPITADAMPSAWG